MLRLALAVWTAALGLSAVCAPSANASASSAASSSMGQLPADRGSWRWPVEGPVLSTFRYGRDPFARGQRRGIRIGAPVGSTVRSACAGRVRFSGAAGTSGRVISVACGGLTATYLHLAASSVRRGQEVRRGQRLGVVGRSGRPRLRVPHLAFGVRLIDRRWGYVDPLALLPRLPGLPPPAPLPPGRRDPRRLPPALGPTPAPAPVRRPVPIEAPARARVPDRVPLGSNGARVPQPAWTIPLATWIGLAALTGALVAWPVRQRRRRSQSRKVAVTGARARGA